MATRPGTIAFAISSPIGRSDLPGLFARVRGLLADSGAAVARCDVSGARADAITVDALARLALAAGRASCRVELVNASPELLDLIELIGVSDVLRAASREGTGAGHADG